MYGVYRKRKRIIEIVWSMYQVGMRVRVPRIGKLRVCGINPRRLMSFKVIAVLILVMLTFGYTFYHYIRVVSMA